MERIFETIWPAKKTTEESDKTMADEKKEKKERVESGTEKSEAEKHEKKDRGKEMELFEEECVLFLKWGGP